MDTRGPSRLFLASRWRKPVDLYALIGALDYLSGAGETLGDFDPEESGERLIQFSESLTQEEPPRQAARYLVAAGRQTDNIQPRSTRISILAEVIAGRP